MNKTAAYILLGFGAFILAQRFLNPTPQVIIPPTPAPTLPGTNAWSNWAQSLINLYGVTAALWQEGGPFYNVPENIFLDDPNLAGSYASVADLV